MTFGYLGTPTPFANGAQQAGFEVDLAKLQFNSLSTMEADRVWLVHYADRTLSRMVGKAPLLLGRPNMLTPDSLLAALGIGI